MKQWNIKAPLVFRLGVVMLCMLIISSNMICDPLRKTHRSVIGTAAASFVGLFIKNTRNYRVVII